MKGIFLAICLAGLPGLALAANETYAEFIAIGCAPQARPDSHILPNQALVVRAFCKNGRAAVLYAQHPDSEPLVQDCGSAPDAYPALRGTTALLATKPCLAWFPQLAVQARPKRQATTAAQTPEARANDELELNALNPHITTKLNNQNCTVSDVRLSAVTGALWETKTMVGVTCADGRLLAAQLHNGAVEVKPCLAGQKSITFTDGVMGDYCAL